jgi:uncharacterized repeat protein (TIGR03803 family)
MKARWSTAARQVVLFVGVVTLASDGVAQTLTTLHTFIAGATDGDRPFAALVLGSNGYFYGTTEFGGSQAVGTVFRISASGAYTNLYSLAGSGFDGWQPLGGLVRGSDGSFYGTTSMKGTNGCSCGTVFRITPGGSYTTLYHFGNTVNDGGYPRGPLVQGTDGNFYGTTPNRGAYAGGVVFRITPNGAYTNLYSFHSYPADGYQPMGPLVQGSDGNFYGTTISGGTNTFGTVFRISPNGSYTSLHSFAGGYYYSNNDGQSPYGGLVQGPDGNFYGTTSKGGSKTASAGVVYRMTPGGTCTTLYSFGDSPDGATPQAGLVLGSDGNFYGTTVAGGLTNYAANGTVFRISPSGQYSNLYSFGAPGSGGPEAALVQGSDGNFYGTTTLNGASFRGTVFKLAASLPSPANQINSLSISGSDVVVTVPSVAGETYHLQYAGNLGSGNWSNVPGASVTNSMGGPLTVTNVGGAASPARYYRLLITP